MLVERKSLVRFLIIYILSTLFLIGVGEYFYYKLSKNIQIKTQKIILEKKINEYLEKRVKVRQFKNFHLEKDMAIYKGNKLIASTFSPPKIDFSKEIFIKGNKIFYIKKLIRPFGVIYVVTYKNLPQDNLIFHLMIFNIFIFIFVIIISFLLGNIFLSPMKRTIDKLENFITDSTHEMNTPISVIMSNIEILQMKGFDNKEFNRILNGAKRLNKIFDDLKFVSLNHSNKKEIQNINLKQFLLTRIEYFELTPKLQLEDVNIEIDKEDVTKLIDNLLSNAKKYSKNWIEIKLDNQLTIKNDGYIHNLNNIKQKFIRENSNEGGFGLGLYIVDKICQEYNFKFIIQNNNGVEIIIKFKE